MSKIIIR